jgi:hypothetical protein
MSGAKRRVGHRVWGAIAGFFLFLFIAADLLFFGVVDLNSAVLTILPVVGIIVGVIWASLGLLGSRHLSPAPSAVMAGIVPPATAFEAPAATFEPPETFEGPATFEPPATTFEAPAAPLPPPTSEPGDG